MRSKYNENMSLMKREVLEVVICFAGRTEGTKIQICLEAKEEEEMKFKAKFVVLGCGLREGINYIETFAPVVKGYYLATTGFGSTTPVCEVKKKMQPPEMESLSNGKVLKLLKALYGLKQLQQTPSTNL